MPNTELHGSRVGVYLDISGTPTLLAARTSYEKTESAETVDITHADNMQVPARIVSVSTANNEITVEGVTETTLLRARRLTIRESTGNDGNYTFGHSDVTDNGDGTLTVALTEGISDSTADGTAHVPSPHGFKRYLQGMQEGETTTEVFTLIDEATGSREASHQHLLDAKHNSDPVTLIRRFPAEDSDQPEERWTAYVTEVTEAAPHDEAANISLTLKHDGPPTYN